MITRLLTTLLLAGLLALPRIQARRTCPECVDLPEIRRVERLQPLLPLDRPEASRGKAVPRG